MAKQSKQYTPEEYTPEQLPFPVIASQLISQSFNSELNQILGKYSFGQLGSIKIGKYSAGSSGEVNITKNGITSINSANQTTFFLDSETGNIDMLGTLKVGSTIETGVITASMINALNITANSVVSTWVYAGNLTANQITTGSMSAARISGGSLVLGGNNNGNGILQIQNSSGDVGLIGDNGGLLIYDNRFSSIIFASSGGSAHLAVSSDSNGGYLSTLNNLNLYLFADGQLYLTADGPVDLSPGGSNKVNCNANLDMKDKNIDACNTIYAYNFSNRSDIRIKKNIVDFNVDIQDIFKLNPVEFNYKKEDDSSGKHLGLIAQEVEQIFPNVVNEDEDGIKSINYNELIIVLLSGFKAMFENSNKSKNNIVNRINEEDLPQLIQKEIAISNDDFIKSVIIKRDKLIKNGHIKNKIV